MPIAPATLRNSSHSMPPLLSLSMSAIMRATSAALGSGWPSVISEACSSSASITPSPGVWCGEVEWGWQRSGWVYWVSAEVWVMGGEWWVLSGQQWMGARERSHRVQRQQGQSSAVMRHAEVAAAAMHGKGAISASTSSCTTSCGGLRQVVPAELTRRMMAYTGHRPAPMAEHSLFLSKVRNARRHCASSLAVSMARTSKRAPPVGGAGADRQTGRAECARLLLALGLQIGLHGLSRGRAESS